MIATLLSLSTLTWAIPTALVVFYIAVRLSLQYRLAKAPGVRAHILGDNPISTIKVAIRAVRMQNANRLVDYFTWLFSQTPPECPNTIEVVFFGRRLLITQEPEHIKTVLTSKFTQFGKGERFHEAWAPFLGDSIFTTDGQQWHNSRTLIRPMFVKDKVRDMDIFQTWTDNLIAKLPSSGQTVDMCDLFYRMTLDVTTDFLLGHGVGSLDNPNGEFTKAFSVVQRTQMLLTILLPFRHFVPQAEYRKGIKVLERFMDPFIEQTLALTPSELENLSKSDKHFTFLHNIALFSRDPKVIRDQIMAVLLAGRDTTAGTLSWTIYELSNYPAVWTKLRKCVLDTVGSDRNPTYDDLKSMTYLTHTLNETLRLYPAVPYNIRSCVETTTLPGAVGQPDITTLKGDHVIYSTLAMQRRKDLYPPVSEIFADPAIFSPERWDHWTPKHWQYVPFNGGPRICIGQNFAMTEMAYILTKLVQKYERVEYRDDWSKQFHKTEIVGCPGRGVPVAFYEPSKE